MKLGIIQSKEMFANLPKDWELRRFSEIVKDSSGGRIKLKKSELLENGDFPVVDQGKELIGGYTNRIDSRIEVENPVIIFGDHTRIFKYIDFDFAVGADGTKIFEVNSGILPKYIYYYFTTLEIPNTGYNRHYKFLKDIVIPVPPFLVQKRIVETLDKADEIIKNRQEAISKLDDLIQSVFLEMFGDSARNDRSWQYNKLGSICNVRSSKRVFKKDLVHEGIPFYRGQEIKSLSLKHVISSDLFISDKHYKEICSSDEIPAPNDLLLPSICPEGEIWVVDTAEPFYFKDGRVLWIQNDETVLKSVYLKYYLKTLFRFKYNEIASGTTFKELKIFILKDLEVLIPPIDLQEKFVNRYSKIVESKTLLVEELKKMETLCSSIQQSSF